MSVPAIDVLGIRKQFRIWSSFFRREIVHALAEISFTVPSGQVFGLLGPNGSGKSTLLYILSTLILPTSGQARVMGVPIRSAADVKRLIGFAPAVPLGFAPRLNARQNLEFYAALQGLHGPAAGRCIASLLKTVGLDEIPIRPYWAYSSGQRQRLNIARALLGEPPILLLDEPCRGLDPWTAVSFRVWIRTELVERRGKTLLLATNQPNDVPGLCDRVGILCQGRLIRTGAAEEVDLRKVP